MTVIQDDVELLLFEQKAYNMPSIRSELLTLSLISTLLTLYLVLKGIALSNILLTILFMSSIASLLYKYAADTSIKVKIDKRTNYLFMKSQTIWKCWEQVEIPLSHIKKIEFPLEFGRSRFVFLLNNNREVNFYVPPKDEIRNYEKIGIKLADYINVPFVMQ